MAVPVVNNAVLWSIGRYVDCGSYVRNHLVALVREVFVHSGIRLM